MSDIPADVLREILLRIPAEFLLSARAVCQGWRREIDDPAFIKTHTNYQLISNSNSTLLYSKENQLFSLSLDSLNNANADQTIEAYPFEPLGHPLPQISHLSGEPFMCSCNGLILIENEEENSWVILNPLTQTFHEVPRLDTNGNFDLYKLGFGYDYSADDYKVVRIGKVNNDSAENAYKTFIYSLKSNSWKMIKDIYLGYHDDFFDSIGVVLNGSLYWKSRDNMIIALDLATEEYSQLQLPDDIVTSWFWDIGAMNGCLLLSIHYMNRMEFWVMKEYKVGKRSWMKIVSLGNIKNVCYSPMAYLKSKGLIVLQEYNWELCLVDIEKKSASKIVFIRGFPNDFDCEIYHPAGSLFRLGQSYDRAKGSGATKRLLLSVTNDADFYFIQFHD